MEADWEDYASSEWRSERVRELDELGGPGRAACQSGSSFTTKLQLLEEQLQDKRSQMQDMLSVPPKKESPKKSSRKFMMYTDKRAAERAGELADMDTVMIGQRELAVANRLAIAVQRERASTPGQPSPPPQRPLHTSRPHRPRAAPPTAQQRSCPRPPG